MQDTVPVINNDRTLWLPTTVAQAADHSSYIVKVMVEQNSDELS